MALAASLLKISSELGNGIMNPIFYIYMVKRVNYIPVDSLVGVRQEIYTRL